MQQLKDIQQKLKAPKNQFNKFGKYNYRSCEDILEAVKPILGDCVLTISDEIVYLGDRYYVKATAVLKNGSEEISVSAFARESESKKGMDSAQVTGSTSSYARKYALNGLFCIDDAKDDDNREPTDDFERQPPNEDKKGMSKNQRNAIVAAGKGCGLSEEETREIVRWKADLEGIDPNSYQICDYFLGKTEDGEWKMQLVINEYNLERIG